MTVTFSIAFSGIGYCIAAASQWTVDDNANAVIGELYQYRTVGSTLFRSWHSLGPNIRWIATGG